MKPLMPPIDTLDKLFHDGNPATGVEGTIVTAAHLNNEQDSIRDLQSELIAVLTAATLAPDSTAGQLLKALKALFLLKTDATTSFDGKQPKDATLTNLSGKDVAGLLTYLGLGNLPDSFGAAAEIDVATSDDVIAGVANKAVTAATLKNRFNSVVLYPNGTEAAPPTLTVKQRIIIDNPFPGRPIAVNVELFANNVWADPYYSISPQAGGNPSAGARASYLYETDKIVIQTGFDGVLAESLLSGSAHDFTSGGDAWGGKIYQSRTYRLRVRAI